MKLLITVDSEGHLLRVTPNDTLENAAPRIGAQFADDNLPPQTAKFARHTRQDAGYVYTTTHRARTFEVDVPLPAPVGHGAAAVSAEQVEKLDAAVARLEVAMKHVHPTPVAAMPVNAEDQALAQAMARMYALLDDSLVYRQGVRLGARDARLGLPFSEVNPVGDDVGSAMAHHLAYRRGYAEGYGAGRHEAATAAVTAAASAADVATAEAAAAAAAATATCSLVTGADVEAMAAVDVTTTATHELNVATEELYTLLHADATYAQGWASGQVYGERNTFFNGAARAEPICDLVRPARAEPIGDLVRQWGYTDGYVRGRMRRYAKETWVTSYIRMLNQCQTSDDVAVVAVAYVQVLESVNSAHVDRLRTYVAYKQTPTCEAAAMLISNAIGRPGRAFAKFTPNELTLDAICLAARQLDVGGRQPWSTAMKRADETYDAAMDRATTLKTTIAQHMADATGVKAVLRTLVSPVDTTTVEWASVRATWLSQAFPPEQAAHVRLVANVLAEIAHMH